MTRAKRKRLVRGEPVVELVLAATIQELATLGYQGLSIDQVARRAGVARTTIYRRWPTKPELVKAAIEALPGAEVAPVEGETVEEVLVEFGLKVARLLETSHGVAIMRLFVDDHGSRELDQLLKEIRQARDESFLDALLALGLERGDVAMLKDLVPAALLSRALVVRAPLTRQYISGLAAFLARRAKPKAGVVPERFDRADHHNRSAPC
jgi:AcrR family transcriptional regulator